MKKFWILLSVIVLSAIPSLTSAKCQYSEGDPIGSFKDCGPKNAIQGEAEPDTDITDAGSDFMTLIQKVVNQAQTITFFIAVGIIVWLGLLMVIPANAEAKEATKGKLISVLLGFLAMISATIIINAIINILYDIF